MERQLINPYKVTRGNGDAVTLGVCAACGRNVTLSSANKVGGRCRYCGAQYWRENGALLYAHGIENGKRWFLRTTSSECDSPLCPGWGHFDAGWGFEIERCDTCKAFPNDAAAREAHVRECGCDFEKTGKISNPRFKRF